VTCPATATDLGVYVLGALEPEERRRVEDHLRRCPACAAELVEFQALPGLLDRVRPGDLNPVAVTPSPDLFDRVSAAAGSSDRATTGGPDRARFRSRAWALVAAAVVAVLGIGAGVAVWVTGSDEQSVTVSAGPVRATVTASSAKDGSALVVTVAGLRPGETCRLVAVDRDGVRHPGGEWPVSGAGDGTWRGWADVDREALTEVVLLGEGGRELARVPF
jgi:anti-sigma factor RsiW